MSCPLNWDRVTIRSRSKRHWNTQAPRPGLGFLFKCPAAAAVPAQKKAPRKQQLCGDVLTIGRPPPFPVDCSRLLQVWTPGCCCLVVQTPPHATYRQRCCGENERHLHSQVISPLLELLIFFFFKKKKKIIIKKFKVQNSCSDWNIFFQKKNLSPKFMQRLEHFCPKKNLKATGTLFSKKTNLKATGTLKV